MYAGRIRFMDSSSEELSCKCTCGGVSRADVEALLDSHAHNLAERIREYFDVKDKPCPVPSGYINPNLAADVIDSNSLQGNPRID